MKLIFKGDFPEGELVCPLTQRTFRFKAGVPIDVPDSIAEGAIKSGLWANADAPQSNQSKNKKTEGES